MISDFWLGSDLMGHSASADARTSEVWQITHSAQQSASKKHLQTYPQTLQWIKRRQPYLRIGELSLCLTPYNPFEYPTQPKEKKKNQNRYLKNKEQKPQTGKLVLWESAQRRGIIYIFLLT